MTPIRGADRVTITVAPADDDDNYSDRAVITDPVEWVVLGTELPVPTSTPATPKPVSSRTTTP